MRILVTGASGLIGGAIVGRLLSRGHAVIAAVRPGSRPPPEAALLEVDFAAMSREAWMGRLADIDAAVNCVGVLQTGAREDPAAAHASGPAALFAACEAAGVRRVIHFSAVGVDRQTPSSFSATKAEGDAALMARDLDWVILRPSVVLGRPVFGASALFRGLAALPVVPKASDAGPLQVVQLDDVVETVARLLERPEVSRAVLELVGPERLTFDEVVARFRRWHGWKPARLITLPAGVFAAFYRLGDLAGWFGWRPAVRSNARAELVRGAVGDPGPWQQATGIAPQSLDAALAASPPSMQDRWFAKLFLLKPAIFVILSAFWIATGLISLGPGWSMGVGHMLVGGAGVLAAPAVIAGALADIAVGVAIAFRRTARLGLYGALAVSLFYAVAGAIIRPDLWIEPLGSMLKIWPIVALHLVALAILDER
jgi:uncharacterized protein YbjT (DUF2867 family)